MSGICDTCQRNQDCRRPMDGMDSCRLYVSGKESNYERLFGTPERAAQTLANACAKCSDNFPCWECPLSDISGSNVYEPELLEWLRGESDGE